MIPADDAAQRIIAAAPVHIPVICARDGQSIDQPPWAFTVDIPGRVITWRCPCGTTNGVPIDPDKFNAAAHAVLRWGPHSASVIPAGPLNPATDGVLIALLAELPTWLEVAL